MRNQVAVSVVLLAVTAGTTGCFSTSRIVEKTQMAAPDTLKTESVEQLVGELGARDAALKTLNAQVMITASTGGAKEGKVTEYTSFRGYIFVQKPEELRVILQLPVLGSRALDMVSDGKTFTLVRATAGHGDVWMQGSNTVTNPSKNGLENLRPPVFLDSLLVPGVKPGEYVTLTISTRVVEAETKHKEAVEEPDYDVTVLKPAKGTLSGGASLLQRERTIHISRVNGLPFEQDIYDDKGALVTVATYDHYEAALMGNGETQAPMFPRLIVIRRPLEEYSLKIEVTKVTMNEVFEADQFELKVPTGVTVQKME